MSSDDEETTVDWENLETIKSFDDGTDHMDSSTKLMDKTDSVNEGFIESMATKATAPVSLLVESLVHQFCAMIEPDEPRAKKLYTTICLQLHRMNLIDETYLMGEFDVMRSQYQRALYQLVTMARGQTNLPLNMESVLPVSDVVGMSWSRYSREFEELDFIAGGGFGRVYRARHKLDGIVYAVKKITIKYQTVNRVLAHLAEVKTFASLNHTNVVPYKAAWLEPLFGNIESKANTTAGRKKKSALVPLRREKFLEVPTRTGTTLKFSDVDDGDSDTATESDEADETSASNISSAPFEAESKLSSRPRGVNADESSDFIQFEAENSNGDDVDGVLMSYTNRTKNRKGKRNRNNALCKHTKVSESPKTKESLEIEQSQSRSKQKWATLYIQMSFCPLTLRTWLDERNRNSDFNEFFKKFLTKYASHGDDDDSPGNRVDAGPHSSRNQTRTIQKDASFEESLNKNWSMEEVALDLFTQVLNALNYIHLQSIVHHDIKPSNIFIGCERNGKMYAQLGDFGLACPRKSKHTADNMFGTPTYAAPEQLAGQCNPKSDLFSLGIILLELLIPFQTDMERIETIRNARTGKIPGTIPSKFRYLLQRLLQHHKKRPSTTELCEIASRIYSGMEDFSEAFGHIKEQNQPEIKTSETDRNTTTTYETTTVSASFQQVSLSVTVASNETIHTSNININNNNNDEISADKENVNGSFDADATGDENDSILASVASIDDKDKLIEFLTNKLMEKNRKESEMSQEIERLRNLLK